MSRRPITSLVLVVAAVLGVACGTSGGFAADQPGQARLEAGELVALPTLAGAAPFGGPTETDRDVTQSFKVTGLAPADVLEFYASALRDQGWVASTAPSEDGDVWRGQWVRGSRRLQVTAEPDVDDGTGDGNDAPTSQLDLVLSAG